MLSSMFIMQYHCNHLPFASMKSLSKLSWNVMKHLPTSPSQISLSTNVAHWAGKGDNIEIPSTCACMHWNLTWLDKTHAFTVWEGFKQRIQAYQWERIWLRIIMTLFQVEHYEGRSGMRNVRTLDYSERVSSIGKPNIILGSTGKTTFSFEGTRMGSEFDLSEVASNGMSITFSTPLS